MWMMPLDLHVNRKSAYDDMMYLPLISPLLTLKVLKFYNEIFHKLIHPIYEEIIC